MPETSRDVLSRLEDKIDKVAETCTETRNELHEYRVALTGIPGVNIGRIGRLEQNMERIPGEMRSDLKIALDERTLHMISLTGAKAWAVVLCLIPLIVGLVLKITGVI